MIAKHELCHDLHGQVNACDFADGCAKEQRKLYGAAPHADKLAILLQGVRGLHDQIKDRLDHNEPPQDPQLLEIDLRQLLQKVQLVDEQIEQAGEPKAGRSILRQTYQTLEYETDLSNRIQGWVDACLKEAGVVDGLDNKTTYAVRLTITQFDE